MWRVWWHLQPWEHQEPQRRLLPGTRAIVRAWQSGVVLHSVTRGRGHEQDAQPCSSRQRNPGGATTGSPMMQCSSHVTPDYLCRTQREMMEKQCDFIVHDRQMYAGCRICGAIHMKMKTIMQRSNQKIRFQKDSYSTDGHWQCACAVIVLTWQDVDHCIPKWFVSRRITGGNMQGYCREYYFVCYHWSWQGRIIIVGAELVCLVSQNALVKCMDCPPDFIFTLEGLYNYI